MCMYSCMCILVYDGTNTFTVMWRPEDNSLDCLSWGFFCFYFLIAGFFFVVVVFKQDFSVA